MLSRFPRRRGESKNPSRLPNVNKVDWNWLREILLQRRVIRRARPGGVRVALRFDAMGSEANAEAATWTTPFSGYAVEGLAATSDGDALQT